MTRSAATLKSRAADEAAEEPPGVTAILNEDEEPPSTSDTARGNGFFGHVPEELWDDWKWHFRNRVTSIDELLKFIPLTPTEQHRFKLVTTIYPISIAPYYFLMNQGIHA